MPPWKAIEIVFARNPGFLAEHSQQKQQAAILQPKACFLILK